MKKYDEDIIKQWIEYTGPETAPEGFSNKVMSRIETENVYIYTNPINKKFILFTLLIFTVLIIIALTLPSAGEYSWIKSIIEKISGFLPEIPDTLSLHNMLIIARYIFYISGGIIAFILTDRFLAKFLAPGKEYSGQA